MLGESTSSHDSDRSHFSLGATNAASQRIAVDGEDDEDLRQLPGDEVISSTAKWHINTEKVFALLKRSITVPSVNVDDDPSTTAAELNNHLMFDSVSKGASRRTAAGVFFELLQLKTWDYIDLEQDVHYGNIKILPGSKFHEDPPRN